MFDYCVNGQLKCSVRTQKQAFTSDLERSLVGTSMHGIVNADGTAMAWPVHDVQPKEMQDLSTGYAVRIPSYRESCPMDKRVAAMESLRADLLRGAAPSLGQMILATQMARNAASKLGRPARSNVAASAVKLIGNSWMHIKDKFPDSDQSGTHSWLARLNVFGVSRSCTLDGFAAYSDAILTRAPYIDAKLTSQALEVASQAMALGCDEIDSQNLRLGEDPSFREIFAAALCELPARLSDHIAPFGPLPEDASKAVMSHEDVVISAAFLPQMQVTVTLARRTKLTMDRMGFAALCGHVLGDTPIPQNASGAYTLRACATLGEDARDVRGVELTAAQMRRLGYALAAFIETPLVERWIERLRLTAGWI